MVLLKNWPFFHLFFLDNIGQEIVFYDILKRKTAYLGNKTKKFKMSKNWHFSKEVKPWFCSKIGHFSIFFFLNNIGQENMFYDILERWNVFLGNKNKKYKKSKSLHFPKGLTHGFAQKLAIFPTFFLGSIPQENVFYDILEQKDAFLSNKKKKFKKSKNWHFSK